MTRHQKPGCYDNDPGRGQAASRVGAPRAAARDDWQIIVDLAGALGATIGMADARAVRAAISASFAGLASYARLADTAFARPVVATHWLQYSNPSERHKWDRLFHNRPLKFSASATGAAVATSNPASTRDQE
jgi:NADH dehydrogenase/NADH:ubiquinone oxidoreductase subunit G